MNNAGSRVGLVRRLVRAALAIAWEAKTREMPAPEAPTEKMDIWPSYRATTASITGCARRRRASSGLGRMGHTSTTQPSVVLHSRAEARIEAHASASNADLPLACNACSWLGATVNEGGFHGAQCGAHFK